MKVRVSDCKFKRKPDQKGYYKLVASLKKHGADKNLSCSQLAYVISEGQPVILAEYEETPEAKISINRNFIKSIQLMTLDVETEKDLHNIPFPIEKVEQIVYELYGIKPIMVYKTFSHTEADPRARLIYYIHRPVDVEEYQSMVTAILHQEELMGRLDKQCKNANRIWQGTDKGVEIRKDYIPVDEVLIEKLKTEYSEKIRPILRNRVIPFGGQTSSLSNMVDKVRIRPQYKNEVREFINNSIDITDYLTRYFGLEPLRSSRHTDVVNCRCPIHGGNNEKGFAIYKNTNTCYCYGNCEKKFDIMQLAYLHYNEYNFNKVAVSVLEDYNLNIRDEWLEILV